MSLVTIVMGTYNGEAYLEEQLESLLANSVTNWNLDIYDDGSVDGTEAIARKYEEKYPGKITFYRNASNKGVTANFLNGARNARGEYVMFCDQDDVWMEHKIEQALGRIKQMEQEYGSRKPLLVFADAVVVDQDLIVTEPSFHLANHLNPHKTDLPHLLMENKCIGCTILFNRALREKLEVLPEHARVHDWWAALIAASLGEIGYIEEAGLLYRQHGKNVIGNQEFAGYAVRRARQAGRQKLAVQACIRQGKELLDYFGGEMEPDKRECLRRFTELAEAGFWRRRIAVIRGKYWKSGLLRNLGLLLLL